MELVNFLPHYLSFSLAKLCGLACFFRRDRKKEELPDHIRYGARIMVGCAKILHVYKAFAFIVYRLAMLMGALLLYMHIEVSKISLLIVQCYTITYLQLSHARSTMCVQHL